MRTTLFATLAALALLAPAAFVLADEADPAAEARTKAAERRAAAQEHRANHTHGNDTDDENETRERPDRPERPERANHTAQREAHRAYMARLHEIRAAWHENATKIREDCHQKSADKPNATREDRIAYAHCIRDGYKDLRAWAVAEIAEAREAARAAGLTHRWHGQG